MVKVAPVLRVAKKIGLPHTVWLSDQSIASIGDLIEDFALQSEFVSSPLVGERSDVAAPPTTLPGSFRAYYRYVREVVRGSSYRPLVVVHGDTPSTLLSAVAGSMAGADIVHLESGLTSGNLIDPFPEEILRRLTFRFTRYAICPGEEASKTMRRYGCHKIVNTLENTLLDCVRYILLAHGDAAENPGSYFVFSIHRSENIRRRASLEKIVEEVVAVSNVGTVYFMLHPTTEERLVRFGLLRRLEDAARVRLEAEMPYPKFVSLLACARAVFSDGGSNQEELSYLGVPTILYRGRSERPDGLDANVVLRGTLESELTEFIKSGALDRLRSPRRLDSAAVPSQVAGEALRRWSIMTDQPSI